MTRYVTISGFRVSYRPSSRGWAVTVYTPEGKRECWTAGSADDAIAEARWIVAEIEKSKEKVTA